MSEEQEPVTNIYADEKEWGEDITPEEDKGLYKRILKEGEEGEGPPDGCKVNVHYTGRLLDGTVFDSSRERNEVFSFNLGKKAVIKGWDVGVKSMRKGEQALLTCRPEYAYGEAGQPPKIPTNATLQFDVELLSWEGEDITSNKDGGVRRLLLEKGSESDYYKPKEGSQCEIYIIGKLDGQVFDEREVDFILGEGSECNIVDGIEIALKEMKKGQKVLLEIKPEYAFGVEGCKDFNVPPRAAVSYEVNLKNFIKIKENWDYENTGERVTEATDIKERGTNYFKQGKYSLALKVYKRALSVVDESHLYKDEDKAATADIRLALQSNLGAVYLKMNDGSEAIAACNTVLEKNPSNIKALFRRGQANIILQEFSEAISDFEECLKLDPENKAAKSRIVFAKQKLKAFKVAEKRHYAKIFERLSEELKNEPDEDDNETKDEEETTNGDDSSAVDGNKQEAMDTAPSEEKNED